MQYTLVKELIPIFEAKLNKYAKKFEKYGSVEYLKSKPYICEDKDDYRYGYFLVDIDVKASYKIADYYFVASLEWIDEAGENLIKKISADEYVPEIYKKRRNCDHCKTNRRRKSTIILKHVDTEEYIQVGKTCVKDYLGYDLGNYAAYLSFFSDLDSYLEVCEKDNLKKYRPQYQVNDILEQTFLDVQRNGYISKAKSIENDCDSTAYRICSMFFEVRDLITGKLIYPKYVFDDSNKDTISNLISDLRDFYTTYPNTEGNDYIDNIKTILKTNWVEGNNISLVVSAIGTMMRIKAEAEAKSIRNLSDYVGEVGEKIQFKAKPECIYSAESPYGGYFHIYKLVVGNNELIWKTTKIIDCDKELTFVAKIKAHTEYSGIKQTEITRAKIS